MNSLSKNSTVDLWKTKIDAAHNYWNYNETLAVGGRIRDRAGKCLTSNTNCLLAVIGFLQNRSFISRRSIIAGGPIYTIPHEQFNNFGRKMPTGLVAIYWYMLYVCGSANDILRGPWFLPIRQCNNAIYTRTIGRIMAFPSTSDVTFAVSRESVGTGLQLFGKMYSIHLSANGNRWLRYKTWFLMRNRSQGININCPLFGRQSLIWLWNN